MSSRTQRINDLLSGSGISRAASIALRLPELIQKQGARLAYGHGNLSACAQNNVLMGEMLLFGLALAMNEAESRPGYRIGGGRAIVAALAVMALSYMSMGDAFTKPLQEDGKISECAKQLISLPTLTYVAMTIGCRMTGRCNPAQLEETLIMPVRLLAAASVVGAGNAVAGHLLYSEEGDAPERERHVMSSRVGMAARFSDAVATLPGMIATLAVYSYGVPGITEGAGAAAADTAAAGLEGGARRKAGRRKLRGRGHYGKKMRGGSVDDFQAV